MKETSSPHREIRNTVIASIFFLLFFGYLFIMSESFAIRVLILVFLLLTLAPSWYDLFFPFDISNVKDEDLKLTDGEFVISRGHMIKRISKTKLMLGKETISQPTIFTNKRAIIPFSFFGKYIMSIKMSFWFSTEKYDWKFFTQNLGFDVIKENETKNGILLQNEKHDSTTEFITEDYQMILESLTK